jgi:hypothetical protein
VGRERGYPLGACGSPCDADYEDGSVPLQLPLSCADHCIEARREGCHLREIERGSSDSQCTAASFWTSSRPAKLSFGPRLRRQALRLRRTAHAAMGLDRSARPNERHPCLDGISMPIAHLVGECATDRPWLRPLANAPLTECRNERRRAHAAMASNVICRRTGTNAL